MNSIHFLQTHFPSSVVLLRCQGRLPSIFPPPRNSIPSPRPMLTYCAGMRGGKPSAAVPKRIFLLSRTFSPFFFHRHPGRPPSMQQPKKVQHSPYRKKKNESLLLCEQAWVDLKRWDLKPFFVESNATKSKMEEGGSPYTRKRGRGVWHSYSWLRRGGEAALLLAERGEGGRLWQNKARTVKNYLKMYDSHFLSTWFPGVIAGLFFTAHTAFSGEKLPLPPPPGPVPWRFSVDRKRTKP